MFERDKDQAVKQVTKRYMLFGAIVLVGIAAGLIIGGWPGVAVAFGTAVAGSIAQDVVHTGHIASNFAENVVSKPATKSQPMATIDTSKQKSFQVSELARREATNDQKHSI